MNKEELKKVIYEHQKHFLGNGGKLADLQYANLQDADLQGANLQGADLRGANLSEAKGLKYSQVSFSAHGECGRQLLAIEIGEEIIYFCGCFKGSLGDFQKYIDDGLTGHKSSRQKALDFVKSCF